MKEVEPEVQYEGVYFEYHSDLELLKNPAFASQVESCFFKRFDYSTHVVLI